MTDKTDAYPSAPMKTKESMLDRIGVRWVLDWVDLTDISENGRDQVRPLEANVPQDLIDDTARAQRDGVDMPPVILYTPNGEAPNGVAGGFRRLGAARKNGATRIPAYVMIEPTEKQIARARVLDNREARPQTRDEKILLANQLVDLYGMTVAEAAQDAELAYHVLYHARKMDEVRAVARRRGLTELERTRLADSTLEQLARVKDDEVGRPLSRFVADQDYSASRTKELVDALTNERSTEDKLALIKRERVAVEELSGSRKVEELHRLRMVIGQMLHTPFDVVFRQADTNEERTSLVRRLEEVRVTTRSWIEMLTE